VKENLGELGGNRKMKIRSHRDLDVYNMAFEAAMEIFHLTRNFPKEEKYSDQKIIQICLFLIE
jgi:hypothetical protein